MKYLPIIICLAIYSVALFMPLPAQTQPAPEETVSLTEATHINDAVLILDSFAWKYQRRKIVNLSSFNGAINIPLTSVTWRKALELIAMRNQLLIEDKPGFIALIDVVVSREDAQEAAAADFDVGTNQVRITATALVADRAYLRGLGIDWSTLLDGKVQLNASFSGASNIASDLFGLSASRITTYDGQPIEVNTLLNVIESNQQGSVMANPSIVVNSGKQGFIQVGQDISVKLKDEAGNTIDTFFSTGIILNVKPTVVRVDTLDVIHLTVSIERSSASPGAVSTVINKNTSSTELILYDGEETAIGGLYDTDELRVRSGIPILKDLPWWVFGIRYLTGFSTYEKKERETVIIIKAEVIDSVIERARNRK
ncbi:MAG: type II and III secretion system protein [Candidatus Cloacimonetes bacterium]|nr:type II and III secretion system protein [Candidatus Cloacimonadota bacterium]